MASLEQRNGIYRIVFRYAGQKLSQSLATDTESVALGLKASLEERIKLIRTNMLPPPSSDCVIAEYLIHGISIPVEPSASSVSQPVKFYELCEQFFDCFLRSSIEDESFGMLQTHKRNLVRHVNAGDSFRLVLHSLAIFRFIHSAMEVTSSVVFLQNIISNNTSQRCFAKACHMATT